MALGCAHRGAEASSRAAVHLGWASGGFASQRAELVLRSDGLVCGLLDGRIVARRIPGRRAEALLGELERVALPSEPSRAHELGRFPGMGGCLAPGYGAAITFASGDAELRTTRFFRSVIPGDEGYSLGDANVERTIGDWRSLILHALEGGSDVDPRRCIAIGLVGDVEPWDRRTLWPTRRAWRALPRDDR